MFSANTLEQFSYWKKQKKNKNKGGANFSLKKEWQDWRCDFISGSHLHFLSFISPFKVPHNVGDWIWPMNWSYWAGNCEKLKYYRLLTISVWSNISVIFNASVIIGHELFFASCLRENLSRHNGKYWLLMASENQNHSSIRGVCILSSMRLEIPSHHPSQVHLATANIWRQVNEYQALFCHTLTFTKFYNPINSFNQCLNPSVWHNKSNFEIYFVPWKRSAKQKCKLSLLRKYMIMIYELFQKSNKNKLPQKLVKLK